MRLAVLYASDLQPNSRIAPGGITNNLRGYLSRLPDDWTIEVWGAQESADGLGVARDLELVGGRVVRFRPIVQAQPVDERRAPLSPRYCAALARAAWRHRLRRRNWDVVISHRTEYHAVLALTQPRAALPNSVAMIHGSSAWSYEAMGMMKGLGQRRGESIAVRNADAVALVAGSTLPYYQSRFPGLADRFLWIPNGVDARRFSAPVDRAAWRSKRGIGVGDHVLVYHGRYDAAKGIGRMLETLGYLRATGEPWHLVCAGAGSEQSVLAAAAAGAHRGFVHDLGIVSHAELPALLGSADVGLLLSDYEGLSNALLECLAAGLPVVATAVGDNPLVLGHVTPDLLTGREPRDIADRVRWAFQQRIALAPAARSTANYFSLDMRAKRLVGLFHSVAGGDLSAFTDRVV